MWEGPEDYLQNFKSIHAKNKHFHFRGHFSGAAGGRVLDCGQYQILTDPCNGLKNPNMNFGNDRSHRLGGV